MNPLTLRIGLFLGLALAVRAAEPTLQERFDTFQETAAAVLEKKSRETGPADGVQPRGTHEYYAGGQLAQLSLRWQNSQNPQEIEQSVMQVVTVAGNDTRLLKAANELLAALKKDREEKAGNLRAELKAQLGAAGAACLAARTPADLDKTLADLSAYRENQYGSSRMVDQAAWQRGANAYRFVSRWQDYLAERASPRDSRNDRVQSLLNELANMTDPELMPRSRILALMSPPPASAPPAVPTDTAPLVSEILGETGTPGDLRAAIARLTRLRGPTSASQPAEEALNQLNTLVEIQARIADGGVPLTSFQETSRGSTSRLTAEDRRHIARLRGAVLLQAAAASLKNAGGAPLADDTLESYVERATAAAIARDDWQLARSALEIYRASLGNISSAVPQWVSSDISSIGAYIAARNQEQAGLHAQAVAGYQNVLRGTGKFVPVEDIGKRLAALRQSHPAAFEEAARLQEAVAPASRALQPQRTRPDAPPTR